MKLSGKHGELSVQPLGAMLYDCLFTLPNGHTVRPLYDAPWRSGSDNNSSDLPPIIRQLGSEWPCVPFARPPHKLPLPDEWLTPTDADWDTWAHGYGSNHNWHLEQSSDCTITATIDYPKDSPIRRLTRTVRLMSDRAGIGLSLQIESRRTVSLPVGLHPVFSMLGAKAGSLQLICPDQARAWSFPIDVEPQKSYFAPDQRSVPLDQLKTIDARLADIRRLPPPGKSEDLILLTGTEGKVALSHTDKNYVASLQWDAQLLPSCLLWISNGGRDYAPWNGRVAAIGIEPVAAAFDLGVSTSANNDTPLAKGGICTALTVRPDCPFQTTYQITVNPLQA